MSSEQQEPWTVRRLVEWASADFRARGVDSPRLDAELLVADALGVSRTQLIIDYDRELEPPVLAKLREGVARRRAREPMAYLRGQREFFGRSFLVDKRVLVPRPDTEVLVETGLQKTADRSLSTRVLDLCTGSGAVAISLAKERPTSRVLATDISSDALAVAQANALRLGAYNVGFALGDGFGPVRAALAPAGLAPQFELIVSNPPYIPSAEIATLMPEVRDHEPHLALDGGADGLDLVRRIVDEAPGYLAPGGWLALEIGAGQAPAVGALLEARGFSAVGAACDLARIERVVFGQWKP